MRHCGPALLLIVPAPGASTVILAIKFNHHETKGKEIKEKIRKCQ